MKTQKTIYHLIVDQSGSMSNCVENTITGFNEQITHIRRLEELYPDQEMTIGLTLFNSKVTHQHFQSAPSIAPFLNVQTYVPNGSTALLDAIGSAVHRLDAAHKDASRTIPTTVVVVIITDGYENASREFSLQDIRTLISRLEASEKWTFSFMGATLDAIDVAARMNIRNSNSMVFDKQTMKEGVWNKLSTSMTHYSEKRKTGRRTDSLFEE